METQGEDAAGKMCSTVAPYTKKKSIYGDRFLPLGEYKWDIFQIPIRIIQVFLGHSDTKTTWGYIVNNQEKEILHTRIRDALANLNELKEAQGS